MAPDVGRADDVEPERVRGEAAVGREPRVDADRALLGAHETTFGVMGHIHSEARWSPQSQIDVMAPVTAHVGNGSSGATFFRPASVAHQPQLDARPSRPRRSVTYFAYPARSRRRSTFPAGRANGAEQLLPR